MSVNRIAAAPVLSAEFERTPASSRRSGQRSFLEILGEGSRAPPAAPLTARPPPVQPRESAPSPLRALVEGAFNAERELDAVVRAGRAKRTFSAAELLELQTKVFRYTQSVEVISRATDKIVGGVKQALGMQV
jgi:hypothetical protein